MIDEAKTPKQIKKASLLTDWLSKYLQMIIEEDAFTRESVPDLKRGNIVFIDMGFNIGEELGGQRPAVVLRNSPKNHKTCVGITRHKPGTKKQESAYICLHRENRRDESFKRTLG